MQSGSRSRWTLAVIGGTALLLALAAAWRVVTNARAGSTSPQETALRVDIVAARVQPMPILLQSVGQALRRLRSGGTAAGNDALMSRSVPRTQRCRALLSKRIRNSMTGAGFMPVASFAHGIRSPPASDVGSHPHAALEGARRGLYVAQCRGD
jgi:hypothetical protein